MFPFIIIGLFFAVCSLFSGLLAMCTRIGSFLSGLLAWLALTFQTITTCLMTYVAFPSLHSSNSLMIHVALSLSRAAMPSIVTAKPPASASRPSPSCGPPLHACSSPVFPTASAVQLDARTADTVDVSNAAGGSSPRRVQTVSEVRGRRTTLKQILQLPCLSESSMTEIVDRPTCQRPCSSSTALISLLRGPLSRHVLGLLSPRYSYV